jgi:hypothetical protein
VAASRYLMIPPPWRGSLSSLCLHKSATTPRASPSLLGAVTARLDHVRAAWG